MATAAKLVASTETVKDSKTFDAAKVFKNSKATTASNSPAQEEQRRKWGVEKVALRPIHARKF
jgi:hypothetical protein